ncbi:uncharacterized protein DSM5745_02508 [Aspergillus mulundensis]|uniref:Uncharacterized protein n=1 Tax=Aspergillus mulundensis TaxID=1810919 RepID=A0A3D8SWP9_9EURO|nr:hypothetical protein DSM5745_02508 [Aspergillus mulundensis]RDW90733.1 hypothetical protein DSM5745_02508 [Aspergillus mulundensis]
MPFSKRMEELLKANRTGSKAPRLNSIYGGWYHAPNGERYFGLGRVQEVGTTHDGGVYVRSEPVSKPVSSIPGTRWAFFDPFTDEDMPKEQYPDRERQYQESEEKYPKRQTRDRYKTAEGLKVGDVAYGSYFSANRIRHFGIGRIVQPWLDAEGKFLNEYFVEPMRGGWAFWEFYALNDMRPESHPRSAYSGSAETQVRSKKKPGYWKVNTYWPTGTGGGPGLPDNEVRLGDECSGAYIRPDGQWFAGVGRVVAYGLAYDLEDEPTFQWVYVEPTGKSGGDYDFIHPVTREYMDEVPSNPVPGVAYPPSQRRLLPARWCNLPAIRRRPEIGSEYPGRYCPPNAPVTDVYLGVGKVVKTGVTKEGRIWVDVVPIPGKSGGNYDFFDPWTGLDMWQWYYPEDCL